MSSNGYRLVRAMRQAGQTPQNEVVDLVIGEVTSVSPLRVKIENRELTETFLIVGPLCKEYKVDSSAFTVPAHSHIVPSSTTQIASDHQHTVPSVTTDPATSTPTSVLLWRGLRVGDRVLMLKVGRGQKYYLMQREEGVTTT